MPPTSSVGGRKTSLLRLHAKDKRTQMKGELSERRVKQAEHSRPSRESKVDCELPGLTVPDN